MKTQTLLAVAISPFGAVFIEQPVATRAERDRPDLLVPAAQARRQVVARWHCTEEGRLEVHWLPCTPEAE